VNAPPPAPRSETRTLALFVTGAAFSNAGSYMQLTAVPFVLFEITDSNAWVGAAAFAGLFLSVVVGPFAGIAIDRYSQRSVLMAGQVVQLVAALGLLVLALTDHLSPWPMIVFIGIGGVGSGLQFPSAQAFPPTIVSPARLPQAVRLNTFGLTVSRTVGPALAGVLLSVSTPSVVFALNASTFVVYLAILSVLRPRAMATTHTEARWAAQYRAAWRYVRARKGLHSILVVGFLGAFFGASISFLVPGIADLYGAGAKGVGALTALYGLGAIVGSAVLIGADDRLERGRATRVGLGIFGLGGVFTVATTAFGVGVAAFIVLGIGYSLWLTSIGTALQVQLTDEFRGRVTTFYVTAVVGGTPLGAVLAGFLGDWVGLRPTLMTYGAVLIAVALAGPLFLDFARLDETAEIVTEPGTTQPGPTRPTAGRHEGAS
jgi:MFS family permease